MSRTVDFNIPENQTLKNNPVEFNVHKDGSKFGTLKVSRAKVEWFKRNSSTNGYALSWEEFVKLIVQHGR